jgi:xanthosine utilization system XapX-like protein
MHPQSCAKSQQDWTKETKDDIAIPRKEIVSQQIMNAQAMRQTAYNSSRLLGLVFRYAAAPLVSFVASYATAILVFLFVAFLRIRFAFNPAFAVVGFCGVISGARCLPQIHRRFGSILLLLLGLVYFCCFVVPWGNQITDEGKTVNMDTLWLVRFVFLFIGGFIATIFAR